MTRYKAGDVVLVRFPFTDLTSDKRRPVLIVSPPGLTGRYHDLVVIPLTGSAQPSDLRLDRWRDAGLLKLTWLKPLIGTVAESLVEKTLGTLHPADDIHVRTAIRMLVDSRFVS